MGSGDYSTFQDRLRVTKPAPKPKAASDAGRVMAWITKQPGLPNWALSRNAHMSSVRVKHACSYLKKTGRAFPHRTEFTCPKTGEEKLFVCWFPVTLKRLSTPSGRCDVAMGYGRECGTIIRERIDFLGRVSYYCPACERRDAGLCRQCPRPTQPKGKDGPPPWFCLSCIAARRAARIRADKQRPEVKARRAARERLRQQTIRATQRQEIAA